MTLSRFNEQLHSIRQRLMTPPPPAAQPDPYAHLPSAKRVYRKACWAKALEIAANVEKRQKRNDLVQRFQ
ncbi:hypothetical protein [Blastomonas sp. CCH2-A2]|uniref:hypothetical protein n=1 Tax=Blastomonas sp. CCH2-A2 TaxID=1768788 RepID=UPI000824EF45|nr:hypothetical protein [Blastomonas sp. CCH2-A2]